MFGTIELAPSEAAMPSGWATGLASNGDIIF
jgi:hypothetical protein